MAASKEAITIVLDVGSSMHNDVNEKPSKLENAKTCVSMIIQRKIFSESKDELALILIGTKVTANNLAEQGDSEFMNIEVVQEFQPANWELLEYVNKIEGSEISSDYIKDNALLVASDLLENVNSKKFFSRRILFLSRFECTFCSDKVNRICDELNRHKIELNVIGPDSLDEDVKNGNGLQPYSDGVKEEKNATTTIKSILKNVNGECYYFSEAIPALIYYQKKKVSALPWNANLDIGTNLTIPISAYIKVTESKPKTWKPVYARKLNAKLERSVTYFMNDAEQTRVSKDNIVPAFKYGTTLVPFTDEDKQNMEYQSGEKGLKVLGFTKATNVQRHHYAGEKSWYVFGQKNRELAGVILAPFIHALHDTKMVAIVRYVYSGRCAPKIGFLAPEIKPDYECLVFILLPFMEDMRHCVFAPLDANSKNLPTEEQLTAVDDLITSMDLSTASVDEDGNLEECLKPKDTVNPYLQRLYQCLHHRGLYPEKPLPPISPHIEAIINPPAKLLKMAESALEKIKAVFPLRECETKKKKEAGPSDFQESYTIHKSEGSAKRRKISAEMKEETVSDVSISDKIAKVGTIQPVQDFQYLVSNKTVHFGEACKQMIEVVYKYMKSESLKHYHPKIISICTELRAASVKENSPTLYNLFMKDLRQELLSCDLELWQKFVKEKISLVSNQEASSSAISPEEADSFLSFSSSGTQASYHSPDVVEEEDYDDLLDQL